MDLFLQEENKRVTIEQFRKHIINRNGADCNTFNVVSLLYRWMMPSLRVESDSMIVKGIPISSFLLI